MSNKEDICLEWDLEEGASVAVNGLDDNIELIVRGAVTVSSAFLTPEVAADIGSRLVEISGKSRSGTGELGCTDRLGDYLLHLMRVLDELGFAQTEKSEPGDGCSLERINGGHWHVQVSKGNALVARSFADGEEPPTKTATEMATEMIIELTSED